MKLNKISVALVTVLVVVVLGTIFAQPQNLFTTTATTYPGLPISFVVHSDTGSNTNPRTVIFESKPICFTRRHESDVMTDPLYPGQLGNTPNHVWMYLPSGRMPSINPIHSTNPDLPDWWTDLPDYIVAHPTVTIDPIDCVWGKKIDKQWMPAAEVSVFPGESLCDYTTSQPEATVIRVTLVIHGDTSDLTSVPGTQIHYIYFAQ